MGTSNASANRTSSLLTKFLSSVPAVFTSSIILRVVLLFYGLCQDAHSSLKFTDIDYLVFTDAARFVSQGKSPYTRATYRYTPLLAWILFPTTWPGWYWFSFGKVLFAASDVVAGWFILSILKRRGINEDTALKYTCAWLLNPMVASISARGSSEGFLCVMVMAFVWAVEIRRITLAGILLGFGVHFKIYPFIYGISALCVLEAKVKTSSSHNGGFPKHLSSFLTRDRLNILLTSLVTFTLLNLLFYVIYSQPFLKHTYLHHLTRIDHRHNFSAYNTLLYLSSSSTSPSSGLRFESLAFFPQILLSTILIPLSCAKLSLPTTLFAQTIAFVTFNKVVTSQYFLWYLVFLPLYLPTSSFVANPRLGVTALVLWVLGQVAWLQQGYQLEFLGRSTFVPGLWLSGLGFFTVNCWILGIVIGDVGKFEYVREG